MSNDLYSKPIAFALVATAVILVGTIVTMFLPMFTPGMHPKLENLEPYTPLQLAGRDFYQREGCNNCHTQTVRPLKTEVMRYGEYSKAGEFAYDRPFLWGSKRTGPDLARVGGKYPDEWHNRHFADPRSFFEKSNMPSYGWMAERPINVDQIRTHMNAIGFPYTEEQMATLADKNELDALVAYTQTIGAALKASMPRPDVSDADLPPELLSANPLAGDGAAADNGRIIYEEQCADCHGADGEGDIGPALNDREFLYLDEDVPDGYYYVVIQHGTESGFPVEGYSVDEIMPAFSSEIGPDETWSLVSYIRSLQGDATEETEKVEE